MYVHPVLVGVIGTIIVEVLACFVYAIYEDSKHGKKD